MKAIHIIYATIARPIWCGGPETDYFMLITTNYLDP